MIQRHNVIYYVHKHRAFLMAVLLLVDYDIVRIYYVLFLPCIIVSNYECSNDILQNEI